MDHSEIRRMLSPYLDNAVSAGEKAEIEAHLSQCERCRTALFELNQMVGHLKDIQEIEPPPEMAAEIMRRVRNLPQPKPALWKRLFLPLSIKLPIEAFAILCLCVTGYYLAQTNAPQYPQTAPSSPSQRDAVRQSLPSVPSLLPAPKTVTPKKFPPEQSAGYRKPDTVPQHAQEKGSYALAPPSASVPATELNAPPASAPAFAPLPTMQNLHDQEKLSQDQLEMKREASRKYEYAPKEMMMKQQILEEQKYSRSKSEQLPKMAAARGPVILPEHYELTLYVKDPVAATVSIEQEVTRPDIVIVRRVYNESNHLIEVNIDAAQFPIFLDRLQTIGTSKKPLPIAKGKGKVELSITW